MRYYEDGFDGLYEVPVDLMGRFCKLMRDHNITVHPVRKLLTASERASATKVIVYKDGTIGLDI